MKAQPELLPGDSAIRAVECPGPDLERVLAKLRADGWRVIAMNAVCVGSWELECARGLPWPGMNQNTPERQQRLTASHRGQEPKVVRRLPL